MTQNRFKINIEYVNILSIVCAVLKTSISSQEIFDKDRIHAGSRENKRPATISLMSATVCVLSNIKLVSNLTRNIYLATGLLHFQVTE